jgi:hypothetical protein
VETLSRARSFVRAWSRKGKIVDARLASHSQGGQATLTYTSTVPYRIQRLGLFTGREESQNRISFLGLAMMLATRSLHIAICEPIGSFL